MIRQNKLEHCIALRGFCGDIAQIQRQADILLSLSTCESFPGAIAEAMAAGTLVVATPAGGIPELIIDNITGILCADASLAAITAGIRRALELDPPSACASSTRRGACARSEFHPQRAASDLMEMYNFAVQQARLREASSLQAAGLEAGGRKGNAGQSSRSNTMETSGKPLGAVRLRSRLTYELRPRRSKWKGLEVLLGTHYRRANGRMVMRVCNSSGDVLREVSRDLQEAYDNEWLMFHFEPIENSTVVPLTVEFSLANAKAPTMLSVYEVAPVQGIVQRGLQRLGARYRGNRLYCRMWYDP